MAAIYCVHGTFAGNDAFGLFTELSRFTPKVSNALGRVGKGTVDLFAGEAGNYTRRYALEFQAGLAAGAKHPIPVRFFNWSSQNNHIARADGAVQLLIELGELASRVPEGDAPARVLLWGHSHGGNVFALLTNLLGADEDSRREFFTAARSFYQPWLGRRTDMPAWTKAESLLANEQHPIRRLQLDIVTFGTPIRYGWDADGYANLLHFVQHRVPPQDVEFQAPVPLRLFPLLLAKHGDYVQQIGISGSNFVPLPLFVRTLQADLKLDKLLEKDLKRENIVRRLRHGTRVADEGTTLLVDYKERALQLRLWGHGVYTRREWLAFHCREVAQRFYGDPL